MTRQVLSIRRVKNWLRPFKRWLNNLIEVKSSILLSQDLSAISSANSGQVEASSSVMKLAQTYPELPVSHKEFLWRVRQGNQLYGIFVDRQLVSWGWVAGPNARVRVVHDLHLSVPERAFYIWDCGTEPAFRGQGYFQALLSGILIANSSTSNQALVTVDTGNKTSRRALVRVGFRSRFAYLSVRFRGSVLFSVALEGWRVTSAQPKFDGLCSEVPNI